MLFGGRESKKSCYLFSPSSQQWTRLPDLPTERCSHNALKISNSIFLIGGRGNNTIEQYKVSSKTFKVVATMKKCLTNFAISLYNNQSLLITGGVNELTVIRDCILFDTSSKQFKNLPSMNIIRMGHVLVNVGGIIYAIGGWNDKDNSLNFIEEFHQSTEEWQTSTLELQIARSGHQAVAHKHFIYVFGGECKNDLLTSTIEKINTETKRVEIIATKLLVERTEFAVAKVGEKIHILGGSTVYKKTDSVEIFDLNTEQIEQGVKMPIKNAHFSACVL